MNNTKDDSKIMNVAVFDFDNTLTRQDSLLPFFRFALGRWQFCWGILVMSPILVGYALKLIPNWKAKEILLIYFLGGKDEKQLNHIAQHFAAQKIPKLLRPEAINRLRWHQERGHQTILLSASLEIYLIPWAKSIGFSQVLGTQIAIKATRYTGRILGKNCHGQEKVTRLQSLLGDLNEYCIHAYGDSRGDLPLLDVADYSYYRTFEIVANEVGR
jgi:HAD superfamily hydrolase (TIGR01490 family)